MKVRERDGITQHLKHMTKAPDSGLKMDAVSYVGWTQATVVINPANISLHYLHHGLTLATSLAPHSHSLTAPSRTGEGAEGNKVR